jgi:uncharacterized protein YciI
MAAMKYALFYDSDPEGKAKAADFFEAHRALWADFHAKGLLLMLGPFMDGEGAMSVWTSKEAAEEFAHKDPFVSQGVVSRWHIREWKEVLSP